MALTKVSNNALSNISVLPSAIETGALTLLSTQTASSSASIEFTSGIDSTYDSYVFKFINCNPATDQVYFEWQGSTDTGSTYGVTVTNTVFQAYHDEADTGSGLSYEAGRDIAQGTSNLNLSARTGNGADECCSGTLQLFNPSSSTYVKHYISRVQTYYDGDYSIEHFTAGYFNTISPIDAVKFLFSSGNFDGIIKMYGVS